MIFPLLHKSFNEKQKPPEKGDAFKQYPPVWGIYLNTGERLFLQDNF
jgi:hypothetical protein